MSATTSAKKTPRAPRIPESMPKPGLSLRPDETMMIGCVLGLEVACAIRDGWKFNLPIFDISAEEFEASQKERVVFIG